MSVVVTAFVIQVSIAIVAFALREKVCRLRYDTLHLRALKSWRDGQLNL